MFIRWLVANIRSPEFLYTQRRGQITLEQNKLQKALAAFEWQEQRTTDVGPPER
jgi:hypothetical protein